MDLSALSAFVHGPNVRHTKTISAAGRRTVAVLVPALERGRGCQSTLVNAHWSRHGKQRQRFLALWVRPLSGQMVLNYVKA